MLGSITSTVSSIKAATEIAKLLVAADRAWDQAELKLKTLEIVNALLEANTKIHEMADEIKLLEAKLKERDEYTFDVTSGLFFKNSDQAKTLPICPKCLQSVEGRPVNMVHPHEDQWKCPVCNYVDRKHYVELGCRVAAMGPGRTIGM